MNVPITPIIAILLPIVPTQTGVSHVLLANQVPHYLDHHVVLVRVVVIFSFKQSFWLYFIYIFSILSWNIKNYFFIAFTEISQKHCSGSRYGTYFTESAAKTACLADSNCKGVYDPRCDNTGTFYLCPISATYQTSSSSCIHEKTTSGNYSNISYKIIKFNMKF